jgi:hypothetical protein
MIVGSPISDIFIVFLPIFVLIFIITVLIFGLDWISQKVFKKRLIPLWIIKEI